MLISERGVDIVLLDQVSDAYALAVLIADDLSLVKISSPALLLRMFSSTKIVFYCHYPDMLLAKHKSFAQGVYRSIFDGLERITTGMVRYCVSSCLTSTHQRTQTSRHTTYLWTAITQRIYLQRHLKVVSHAVVSPLFYILQSHRKM